MGSWLQAKKKKKIFVEYDYDYDYDSGHVVPLKQLFLLPIFLSIVSSFLEYQCLLVHSSSPPPLLTDTHTYALHSILYHPSYFYSYFYNLTLF